MYISKKELLEVTGISYGQLYRWKREHLIPEEWFIKQSSYTGQETVFLREQILRRIKLIMEMKDNYSLEQIADMLNANPDKKELDFEHLCTMEEIDPDVAAFLKRDIYSYVEAALIAILSKVHQKYEIELEKIQELLTGILENMESLPPADNRLIIIEAEQKYFGIITGENTSFTLDNRLNIVESFNIEYLVSNIKFKYKDIFQEA